MPAAVLTLTNAFSQISSAPVAWQQRAACSSGPPASVAGPPTKSAALPACIERWTSAIRSAIVSPSPAALSTFIAFTNAVVGTSLLYGSRGRPVSSAGGGGGFR